MQTFLTLCGLSAVITGLGVFVFWQVVLGLRAGRIRLRGLVFDRQGQPALFWLILGLYGFAGASLLLWGLMLVGMMGLYAIEMTFG